MRNEHPAFQPTVSRMDGRTFYVSQKRGDDKDPGTARRPFRTLDRAARQVRPGDTVVVASGIYRETVELTANGHIYVPESVITFIAAPRARVRVRGSDEFHGPWKKVPGMTDVFTAALPESLFRPEAYNPFALDLDFNDPRPVRPGGDAPVRGVFWIDGVPGHAVRKLVNPGDFRISGDGRHVIMRFPPGRDPADCRVEISMRRQCFAAQFPGPALYAVRGIDVGHAVEPGAFDGPREETVRRWPEAGVTVVKEFVSPSTAPTGYPIPFSGTAARLPDGRLILSRGCSTEPGLDFADLPMIGTPDGRRWQPLSGAPAVRRSNFFYDETSQTLYRYYSDVPHSFDTHDKWRNLIAASRDGGATWSEPEEIPGRGRLPFRMHRRNDGRLMLLYTEQDPRMRIFHSRFGVMIGTPGTSGIAWRDGGGLQVESSQSFCGLDEPAAVRLPDGRWLLLLRAGARLPGDGTPGVTSGKLFSVSRDDGESWSAPEFLRYDDGSTVYSPHSFHGLFVSQADRRVYAVMNLSPEPCWNCDPRNELDLCEIDPDTLRVRRGRIVPVEKMAPDHHPLVRFSNFQLIGTADRELLVMMTIGVSEMCFARYGWDRSIYCYRVKFDA